MQSRGYRHAPLGLQRATVIEGVGEDGEDIVVSYRLRGNAASAASAAT